jgi:hypothetical protein
MGALESSRDLARWHCPNGSLVKRQLRDDGALRRGSLAPGSISGLPGFAPNAPEPRIWNVV